MNISRAQIKSIRSLGQKKARREQERYVVEGLKLCREWLCAKAPVYELVATETILAAHPDLAGLAASCGHHWQVATEQDFVQMSALHTPPGVLLVAGIPVVQSGASAAAMVLEGIRNPGNLGAILRIADWFGFGRVVVSPDSAEFWNPKVIQAGMGAHLRVAMERTELPSWLDSCGLKSYAAVLGGENIFALDKTSEPIALLIGNESEGLSEGLASLAHHRVAIPRLGGAESLNAAVAAGILTAALLEPQLTAC